MGKTIADIRRKYRSINLLDLLDVAIEQTSNILLDLVRSQLRVGKSAVGQLPEYKSLYYAKKKQLFGSLAPFGITDLILTGSFTDNFYIRHTKKYIFIRSKDFKDAVLRSRYGTEIYKLSKENFKYYVDAIIKPKIEELVKSK